MPVDDQRRLVGASGTSVRLATNSKDAAAVRGIAGVLRRRVRDLLLSATYPTLAVREYVRPVRGLHLRVVLYHFVFDDERGRFEDHLRYFRDHYEVLSLSEALRRLRDGGLSGPTLAITFDDGYKNNRANAAELLAKHGLVGCFYVTTDLVSLPAGDRLALARMCRDRFLMANPVENLDWDDVRWLTRAGHEIGSHTVTHPDLSRCDRDRAIREIVESRRILERELGHSVRHFGVPWGLVRHVPPAAAGIVREAGYDSCALATGGSNLPAHDAYFLRRDPLTASYPVWEVRARLLRTARRTSPFALLETERSPEALQ
jgi:peptidoglycan/xylan/chitin deacetylase (PgdA/CDA1 family)